MQNSASEEIWYWWWYDQQLFQQALIPLCPDCLQGFHLSCQPSMLPWHLTPLLDTLVYGDGAVLAEKSCDVMSCDVDLSTKLYGHLYVWCCPPILQISNNPGL